MIGPCILSELMRVKVLFQQRAIVAALGCSEHDPRAQQNERQTHCGGEGLRAADFQSIHNGEISNG